MNFTINKIISTISTVLICEVILLGNGKWSEYYLGFNFRKILLILLIILLCIRFFNNKTIFKLNFLYLIFIPAGSFLLWAVIVPMITGTRWGDSMKEGSIIIGFMILPLIVEFYLNNKILWDSNKKWIFLSIFILSFSHIVLAIALKYPLFGSEKIIEFYSDILNVAQDSSLNLNNSAEEIRVGWVSSPFIAIFIGSIFLLNFNRIYIFIISAVSLLALYFNGQRGLYFAIIYSGFWALFEYYLLSKKLSWERKLIFPILVILSAILIFFASDPNFLELIGFSRPLSDEVRYSQSKVLINEFGDHMFFGKGIGATSSAIDRSEESPYSFEQFLLSLLMKTGLMGIAIFFIYSMIWQSYAEKKRLILSTKGERKKYNSLFFMTLFIFSASASNPYLFNFVGLIFLYIVTIEYSLMFN